MASAVTETPAASPDDAIRHFSARLGFETDCADVHQSLRLDKKDFVLLDVRSPDLYRAGHVPGAVNMPRSDITPETMKQWPKDTLFVVYCAGPHCNGANKAALVLATLGRPVKEMIGGITGWQDEGFAFVEGE